jgi:hypothetical protein
MRLKMQEVLVEAQKLSLVEQLDLIRALSESLQGQYQEVVRQLQATTQDIIPGSVMRTKPVADLDEYNADFWPDNESVDELNAYIRQERTAK